MIHLYILSLVLFGYTSCTSEPNAFDPVINVLNTTQRNRHGIPIIQGQIREDERVVSLDTPLTASDQDTIGGASFICGYKVIAQKRRRIPFIVELKDRSTGAAIIRLAEGKKLNFKKRQTYKFSLIAYDCGGIRRESNRVIVSISVKDVDKFSPVFEKPRYFVDLEEGKLYNPLLTLRATDQDASDTYRSICGYEILTPEVPFSIDNNGNLKNTEEIYYSQRHNFILQVVAKDCGDKKSEPVFINIRILEVCRSGWKGVSDHFDYEAGSGLQPVVPQAELRWCNESCIPENINVRMKLTTKHIGKGCDRDTYSITSQRKLCGASGDSVDLLPSPSLATTWTQSLHTDDGHESDQVFYFDGRTNAVEVPNSHFDHMLHHHFSISTWMKHELVQETHTKSKHGEKEHILCMSDGENMNRHHYSLFVHGEKLIFLLRREPEKGEKMNVFKPAEWRWHLQQINDGEWHHYTLSVDFPKVRLYIDGKLLQGDGSNEEIIDDWPIHKSKKVHDTKLSVGACWQGREQTFAHYFHGFLAGLSILKDKTESDRVIKCLNNCKEYLDFHAVSEMHSGTSVTFNSEMTEFNVLGRNVTEIQNIVRQVMYVNARRFPTPGRRNINVKTTAHCPNKDIVLPPVDTYVKVHQAHEPLISITGTKVHQSTLGNLRIGQRIFHDLHIGVDVIMDDDDLQEDDEGHVHFTSHTPKTSKLNSAKVKKNLDLKTRRLDYKMSKSLKLQDTQSKSDLSDDVLLDKCTIRANPPLNLQYEHLTLPTDVMNQFNMRLEGSETKEGLVILNADKKENYEMVLRGIYYYYDDKGKNSLNSRKFVLSCSSQNARFISNEFEVQIIALHEEHHQVVHAYAQKQESPRMQQFQLDGISGSNAGMVMSINASPNVGMVAIIVVCVGFLLFMIILGVIRIRAAHQRTQTVRIDEPPLEWDDSALNITVNPMERGQVFEYEDDAKRSLKDDSDSDDDIDSYRDEECDSSDEEEVQPKKLRDLEWDDSM